MGAGTATSRNGHVALGVAFLAWASFILALGLLMAASAGADNMPPPPPPPSGGGQPASQPPVVVIQPSPQPQPQTQSRSASRPVPQPQSPAVSGDNFLDPNAAQPSENFVDPGALAPATQGPAVQLSPAQTATPAPTVAVPPAASGGGGSSLPLTPIGAALALAGAAALIGSLGSPSIPCERARAALAAQCADLQAAGERLRVAQGRHDSADAGLRAALAAPSIHALDGSPAVALRPLRRARHHARDELGWARSHAFEARRRYDEALGAVPARCGPCPPCAAAVPAGRSLVSTAV